MSGAEGPFRGPLFLIGMPRSGTKLLRGLLNQRGAVHIPDLETEFLPFWVRSWERFGDLADRGAFHAFYEEMTVLPYFTYQREEGIPVLSEADWYAGCRAFTPAGVFEALIRHDTEVGPESLGIWGDKSPSYIHHIPLLREIFPNARFIHIIRDVRDHCLSMQKTWGKNPIRAAQRWVDGVATARRDAAALGSAALEIRYEDLLATPALVLKRCCALLEIPFDPAMLELRRATENLGDARGIKGLKKDNAGKWRTAMDPRLRARVERVAADVLRALDYPVDHVGPAVRVPAPELLLYQAADAIALVRSEVARHGVLGAIDFHWKLFRINGNRARNRRGRPACPSRRGAV